jgi:hypothetical protein
VSLPTLGTSILPVYVFYYPINYGSLGINGETCIYNGFPFSRE